MNMREAYTDFCSAQPHVPLFLQPAWWDAVAGADKWDAVVVSKGGQAVAGMPYIFHTKAALTTLTQPPLTPYCGWVMSYPTGQKTHTRLAYEHEVMKMLVEELPKYDRLHLRLYPSGQHLYQWLWAGVQARLRYTYVLDLIHDEQVLFGGLRENLRRALRNTEDWVTKMNGTDAAAMLFQLKRHDHDNQGKPLPIDLDGMTRVADFLQKTDMGGILSVARPDGQQAGAVLLAIDGNSCIYIAGATASDQRNSGASTRMLWEAIRYAKQRGCTRFDFEGSMIPSIENYFRAFNGSPTVFHELVHDRHFLLRLKAVFQRKKGT